MKLHDYKKFRKGSKTEEAVCRNATAVLLEHFLSRLNLSEDEYCVMLGRCHLVCNFTNISLRTVWWVHPSMSCYQI